MKRLLIVPTLLLALVAPDPASASERALPAPTITSATIDGNFATVIWQWSYDDHDWDVVNFNVKRNGASLGVAVARAQPYFAGTQLRRGIIDVVPGYGTHSYCIDVQARMDDGTTDTSTACADVTLEAAAEVVVTGGNGLSGWFNKNAANLTLEYQLWDGGALSTDCSKTLSVLVNPPSPVHQHNCDPTSGKRTVVINNPAPGEATAFIVSFRLGTASLLKWLVSSS
jgi:hypothetical protein